MVQNKYVGFYWTLPVPWAGFTSLSDDVDEAARQSRTICYQRDSVRRWVADEHGILVAEKVFLELEPDRASEFIKASLAEAIALCRTHGAKLVYVNFQEIHHARPHDFMRNCLQKAGIDAVGLFPEAEQPSADRQGFDPIEHFRGWQAAYDDHRRAKPAKALSIQQEIYRLREAGHSWAAVADWLNDNGFTTLNGKPWSTDNVRKFASAK